MSRTHVVEQGECLSTIAESYSLRWQTVWNFDENAELRQKRGSPNILFRGDIVAIPDVTPKEFRLATGRVYRFVAQTNQPRLRIRMRLNGSTLKGEAYNLYLDDAADPIAGAFNDASEVDEPIPVNAKRATVEVLSRGITREFLLGHLDPVDTIPGAQARLRQLGFYQGRVDGVFGPLSLAALQGFQNAAGLNTSGELDADTLDALRAAYGS